MAKTDKIAHASTNGSTSTTETTTIVTSPPAPTFNPKDPVEIQVLRSELATAGQFRLIARVLNHKGDGLNKKKVGFIFQGNLEEVETNSEGVCQFPSDLSCPIKLCPGKEARIMAVVSGISQLTTTNICRHRKLTAEEKATGLKNNQRARWFFAIAGIGFAIWLILSTAIMFFSGLGEPILSNSHELTAQEKFFNTIPGVAPIKPIEGDLGNWQLPAILLSLGAIVLWTIFSFVYGILSLREEVAEAWRKGMEALVDKHFVKAQDPTWERFFSNLGYITRASIPKATAASSASSDGAKKTGFWSYFSADIASEILIEMFPRILRTILGGK